MKTQSSVYDQYGKRKYLNKDERFYFMKKCNSLEISERTFCLFIAETGCRISEALNLTADEIDIQNMTVSIRCLKKRRKDIYRQVPLSGSLVRLLDKAYDLENGREGGGRLWPWSRMTGYRRIIHVMKMAGIEGPQASPKGLRHGFAIAAIQTGIPINLVQRWLGHADISTTAIYTFVLGPEERGFAERMWVKKKRCQPLSRKKDASPYEVSA